MTLNVCRLKAGMWKEKNVFEESSVGLIRVFSKNFDYMEVGAVFLNNKLKTSIKYQYFLSLN